jgi:hypothetical protein
MKQKDNYIAKQIRDSISVIDSKAQVIVFGQEPEAMPE